MRTSSRKRLYLILALAFAGVCGCFAWLVWTVNQQFFLENQVPADVFAKVFEMPVPAGVSEMKVAGFIFTSGQVSMKFHAQNVHAVIASMKANRVVPIDGPQEQSDFNDYPRRKYALENRYNKEIDWNAVYRVLKPEYYSFSNAQIPGTGWVGSVIVDRRTGTFYIYGELL